MKKIISYNLNGIRAALGKGLIDWLKIENPDIICFQETKAQIDQIDTPLFEALGYHCHWHSAQKKGYSGVGILSKQKPDNVVVGIGIPEYDAEGRVIRADFGDFTHVCTYFPSGTSGDERQDVKMKFLADYQIFINELKKTRPNLIVSGDYNIAHKEIDINNPKANEGNSGFLPEERAWITSFLESGFTDSFRIFNQYPKQYSWWTYRFNSRARNVGWRIDYHMVSNPFVPKLTGASILMDVVHSDHCPVVVMADF